MPRASTGMFEVLAISVVLSIKGFPDFGSTSPKTFQNLRHLISTLATSNIYDNIRIRPFCDLMSAGHRLTRSESSRDRSRSTFCNREHRIQNSLSCYQMRHTCRNLRLTGLGTRIGQCCVIESSRFSPLNSSIITVSSIVYSPSGTTDITVPPTWRNYTFVHDSPRLRHFRNDRSTLYHIAFRHCDMRLPELLRPVHPH